MTSQVLLALKDSSHENGVVILPIGSLENHGVLPLGTDILVAECVSKKAAEQATCQDVVVAPPIAYSVAIEHKEPRATCRPDTFIRYLEEVSISILDWSRGVVLAVFHGGVFPAVYLVARSLRVKGHNVAVYNAWDSVSRLVREMYGVELGLIHADPIEASILLACGYNIGLEITSKEEVLKSLHVLKLPLLTPWIYRDVPGLYPSVSVPASRELGSELVEALANDLAKYSCSLARNDT